MSASAAVVIPFDPFNRTYMLVRSTAWHPIPAYRNRLKGLGGVVEPGEDYVSAVHRELEEELPGWFEKARFPGSSSRWGEIPLETVKDGKGLVNAGVFGSAKSILWLAYAVPADIGRVSFQLARSAARESSPEVWRIGQIPHKLYCLPAFKDVILGVHDIIYQAYPSLRP